MINYEELEDNLWSIRHTITQNNRELFQNANKDRKMIDYNAVEDKETYNKDYVIPTKNISKEKLYENIVVKYNLQNVFPKDTFDKIYDIYFTKYAGNEFQFDGFLIEGLVNYVHYLDYKNEKQVDMSFEQFDKEEFYEQWKQEKENAKWREETAQIQKDFVPRTPAELEREYAEYKYYIDDNYRKMVVQLGCEDVIPLRKFLELYDKADRNFENVDIPINDRLLSQVISEYTKIFGLEGAISTKEMWGLVRKAMEENGDLSFRSNMEQLGTKEEVEEKGRSL